MHRTFGYEERHNVIHFSSGTLKTGLHGFLQNCATLKKVCKKTSKKPALVRGVF
jgi:hypothetical protein